MVNNTKITTSTFLHIVLIFTLSLNAQDSIIAYHLNMLTTTLQNLMRLLPVTSKTVNLVIDPNDKVLAVDIVLDKQNPSIITLLDTNTLIIQDVKAVSKPSLPDFQVSLRSPNQVDQFFIPIFSQRHQLYGFRRVYQEQAPYLLKELISFNEVPNDIKIAALELIINKYLSPVSRVSQNLSQKIWEKILQPVKIQTTLDEPLSGAEELIFEKANLIKSFEIIFLQLYFLGILSTFTNDTKRLKKIFDDLDIAYYLKFTANWIKGHPQKEQQVLMQEYQNLTNHLVTVATNYIINKLPKDNLQLQQFGNQLLNQLKQDIKI